MRMILALTAFVALGLAPAAGAVTVKRSDCVRIVRHAPAPDVAYQPGVDVNGNPVAPADIDGAIKVEPLSEIGIPITVDLQERFGIPGNPALYEGEAHVGTVTFDDESAFFNGQRLATDSDADLVAACRDALRSER